MGMPTDSELKEALATAAEMREQGHDSHHIAKSLLNLNYRVKQLEKVLQAAERYYHSGMAVQEQTRLKLAIDAANEQITRTRGDYDTNPLF